MKHKYLKEGRVFLRAHFFKTKLTCLLAAGVFSSASANSYAQRIDLNLKNTSFKQVFSNLEKQSGYYFLYDNTLLSDKNNLDVSFKNVDFKQALSEIAADNDLNYRIVNNTVTLYSKTKQSVVQAEEITISGVVRVMDVGSTTPVTMPGVNVNVKGTNKGTTTNNRGEFSIKIPKNGTLIFSFLGFEQQEIVVANDMPLVIVLKESVDILKEVVITGYNTKEAKENQVGSAYTVTAKELENRPVDRIDKILEGMVPGFQVQSQDDSNASSRSRFATRIRGESSAGYGTSSNEPLWVLDGIQLYTGGTTNSMPGVEISVSPLSYLNPSDIESITVLKDASATTIYGANAANGVVIITTKKGNGKNKVNYSYRGGVNTVSKNQRVKVLNGPQYNSILEDLGLTANIHPYNTDWMDTYYTTGHNTQHNLSFSGSNDNTNHYLSIGYFNETPITVANNTKRISARVNLEQKVGKRFSLFFSSGNSYNLNDMFNSSKVYNLRPTIPVYNEDGTYALRDPEGNRIFSSLAEAYQNDYNQKTFATTTNAGFTAQIIDGLSFRSNNGIDYSSTNEYEYRSNQNLSGFSSNGYARRNQNQVLRWLTANTLSYNKTIFDGVLDVIVGTEAQQTIRNSVGAFGSNFPNDFIKEPSLAPLINRTATSSSDDNTALSYFGKIGYVWKSRYAINFNYRKDGNSNFGSDVRWGNFNSIGAAWTISNEEFWKSEIMDFAKLKFSYGTNGNSRFGANSAKGIYTFSDNYFYDTETGAVMTGGLNSGLKWETTKMLNIGVDVRFLKRFSFAAEYYLNKTHDLIDDAYVSLTSGQRRILQNVGKLQNQGIEFLINTQNIVSKDFTWNTNFNFALNRNKILEMAEGLDRSYGTSIMREGEDSKAFYLVRWAGVDPSTGKPMWYDANGNLTFVYNTNDRVIAGSTTPKFFGGMTNNLRYKDFSLSFQLIYNVGGKMLSTVLKNSINDGLNILESNQAVELLDHWRYPGDITNVPAISQISSSSTLNSTRFLVDKTNVRLHNVSFQYSLPKSLADKFSLSRVSVYVQGDNLGMWTPYKNSGNVNTYRNVYNGGSPVQKTISFGLNVGF